MKSFLLLDSFMMWIVTVFEPNRKKRTFVYLLWMKYEYEFIYLFISVDNFEIIFSAHIIV